MNITTMVTVETLSVETIKTTRSKMLTILKWYNKVCCATIVTQMMSTTMTSRYIRFWIQSGMDRYSQVGIPKVIMTSSTTWTCVVQVWKMRCVNTKDGEVTRRPQEDQDWSSSSHKVCIDSLIVVHVCFKNMNIYRDSVEDL